MSIKIPEGLKCEVTLGQAYPKGIPEIPEGWEFVRFACPKPTEDEARLNPDGFPMALNHLARDGDSPRIIVRRKPVKHKFIGGLPGICQRFGCGKPASDPIHEVAAPVPSTMPHVSTGLWCRCGRRWDDPIHEQPPVPKPRMMQSNPACLEIPILKSHAVEHPEKFGCSTPPICIPVEQPKARRFLVEFPFDGPISDGMTCARTVRIIREVKPTTRAEIDKVCRGTFNYPQVSPAWFSERLRELGIEVEE